MSSPFPQPSPSALRREDDWSPLWVLLPSWLGSVLFHIAAILVMALLLKHWEPTSVGTHEGPEREVGIYIKEAGDGLEAGGAPSQDSAPATDTPTEVTQQTDAPVASDTPPVPIDLPKRPELNILGVGTPSSSARVGDPREMIKSGGTGTGTGSGFGPGSGLSGMIGSVKFHGASDKGTRIVYVLDCSGSMGDYGAMRASKAELMASLQSLSSEQQFQIIFYNDRPHVLKLRNEPKPQLHFATEINRTLAHQFIAGIQPTGGTNHMPALKQGLALNPEVLFFLTDAKEPILTAGDLNEIDRVNQGRAHIHCIEFGKGPELKTDNFLQRLARQNGGSYHYRDVTQFEKLK